MNFKVIVVAGLMGLIVEFGIRDVAGADWPRWRGPNADGISTETGWSSDLSRSQIVWKAKAGKGFSSPTVADGRVFIPGLDEKTETIRAFDEKTGKEIWSHSYPTRFKPKFYEGGTSGTPAVDGDHVYLLGQMGALFCFEAATGRIIWEKDIAKETGAKPATWGFTGAPLVFGDLLILNVGDSGTAVRKSDGKVVWKSGGEKAAYSTPFVFERDGMKELLIFNTAGLNSVNPASGKVNWHFEWDTEYGVNAADPIVHENRIFISSGYKRGCALLDLSGKKPRKIYENKNLRTQLNAAVLIDGHLYGVDGDTSGRATLRCINFDTGDVNWNYKGVGSGAVIAAGGKLIVVTDKGEVQVGGASPDGFKPESRIQVVGGKVWTAPVLANGHLLIRSSKGDLASVKLGSQIN
jgi:outer membrane protein assembly factor BamB